MHSIFKKIVRALLSLIIISGALFYLRTVSSSDPIKKEVLLNSNLTTNAKKERAYNKLASNFGLDKPLFFWSIVPAHYPKELLYFKKQHRKELLESYFYKYGNWDAIARYSEQLDELESFKNKNAKQLKKDSVFFKTKKNLEKIFIEKEIEQSKKWLEQIRNLVNQDSVFIQMLDETTTTLSHFSTQKDHTSFFKPRFVWHGFDNQYFNWFSNCLRLDFGQSIIKKRSVNDLFKAHLPWTLLINSISFFLSLVFSISLSLWFTGQKKWLDRAYRLFLFTIASVPVFWIAKMAMLNLTKNNYALSIGIFPTRSNMIWQSDVWATLAQYGQYLILPILCLSLVQMVGLSLQLIYKIKEEESKAYVLSLKAKGLSKRSIRWKHLLKNAAIPMITLVIARFPSLLLGSVLIEMVFNIKGMGKLFVGAVGASDWFLMNAIVMAFAILVVLFNILGDFLYQWADPRMKK